MIVRARLRFLEFLHHRRKGAAAVELVRNGKRAGKQPHGSCHFLVIPAIAEVTDHNPGLSGEPPLQYLPTGREEGSRVVGGLRRRHLRGHFDRDHFGLEGGNLRRFCFERQLHCGDKLGKQVPPILLARLRVVILFLLQQFVLPGGKVGILEHFFGGGLQGLADFPHEAVQGCRIRAKRRQSDNQYVPVLRQRKQRCPDNGTTVERERTPLLFLEKLLQPLSLPLGGKRTKIRLLPRRGKVLLNDLHRYLHSWAALKGGSQNLVPRNDRLQGALQRFNLQIAFEQNSNRGVESGLLRSQQPKVLLLR